MSFKKDSFWEDQLKNREDAYVIKGEHYRVGSEDRKFKGMDGRKFRIKIHATGEVITTTNLWHQGTIPESYKKLLPDTASFVRTIEVKYED